MANDRTPEEIAALAAEAKKAKKLYDDINKALGKTVDATERLTKLERARVDKLLEEGDIRKSMTAIFEQAAAAQKEFAAISERIFDITEKTSTYHDAIAKSHEAGYKAAREQHTLMLKAKRELKEKLDFHREFGKDKSGWNDEDEKREKENLVHLERQLELSDSHLTVIEAATEELKHQAKGYARVEKATAGWIQNLTGITEKGFENSVLGTIDAVGGLTNVLGAAGIQMAQTFTVANVLGSGMTGIINETIRMVAATDSATAQFYKATGASAEYSTMITEIREESAIFGVNIKESAEAISTLYTQMAGFTDLTKEAQKEVANFTGRMSQLGISAGTTADLLNSGTKSLNLTSKEAQNMVLDVTAAARALNIPVAQMNEDLKAAMPTLAAYGKAGVKIFKNIAAQAKAAGLATSDLLGITEQFDTFESAAESVGRLNGILGGNYLNSLEMVNMSEDERIRALVQTFEMTGKNWEALGKYERKAIAASIGISDMDKANKLLGMSTEELDKKMSAADAGILSPEQMQEMADKARSFMEKLENIGQSLAVFLGPIISIINTLLEGFLWLDNVLGGMLAPTIMAVAGAFLYWRLQERGMTVEAAVGAAHRLLFMGQETVATVTQTTARAARVAMIRMGITFGAREALMRRHNIATVWAIIIAKKIKNAVEFLSNQEKMRALAIAAREFVWNKITAAWTAIKTTLKIGETSATQALTWAKVKDNIVTVVSVAWGWAKVAVMTALKIAAGLLIFVTNALGIAQLARLAVQKTLTMETWRTIGAYIIEKGALIASTVATWVLVAAKWALAAAAWAAASPVMLLVGALMLLGVALFVSLHSPPLFVGLGILAILLWALFPALTALIPVLYPAGIGMIFFGLGVMMAGAGMLQAGIGAMFFGVAMILVAAALVIASVALWSAVGAILALALGITIIGLFAWIAAPGLILLAGAIIILSSALFGFALVSWLVLPPLFMLAIAVAIIGVSMALMFNAMSKGVGDIGAMASGLKEISAAMSEMSLYSVLKFMLLTEGFENMAGIGGAAPALLATADVIRSTIDVDTSKVQAVEDLVDGLSTLAITAAISPGLIIAGALLGGLTAALGGGEEADGAEKKGQDIYLVMDPSGTKVLAKAIDVQLNKMHNVVARRS